MSDTSFLPTLSSFDVEQAINLIQRAYLPSTTVTPSELKRLQQDLFEIQKRPEAWGLVLPLLSHHDPTVQFFGAHTAQVKIARDWDAFPSQSVESLRDLMLQLTAHNAAIGRDKFILRKLFVALTSLALKLAPGHPSKWPDWILSSLTTFSNLGVSAEHLHDFLSIAAEEIGNADLLGSNRAQVQQSMKDGTPLVMQAILSTISQPPGSGPPLNQYVSALNCFQAWLGLLPADDIVPIIPMLLAFLDPATTDERLFISASDTLQEIMSKSALSDGSGTKTLTEPLLVWFDVVGTRIFETAAGNDDMTEIFHSLCKLLVGLGDHSTKYFADNIASMVPIPTTPPTSRGHVIQRFLRLMLSYTGLPGYYGVDEEESELTLGFWYLYQEALWNTEYFTEDPETERSSVPPEDAGATNGDFQQMRLAKAVYMELIKVLRNKVVFPPPGSGWSKDQVEKFNVYRRDVGDTLINAFYVLREDLLGYYVNEISERLVSVGEGDGWQDTEATLHCIMSIQEAVDMEKADALHRLFSPEVFGKLPSSGRSRVRKTALGVIGAYSSWFALQAHPPVTSSQPNLLLTALSYVVSALPDASLSLPAATALRNLCEANRKDLAPHIGAFGELHAGLSNIPDPEKSKVLESIASVIQAMPPKDGIPAIEAVVNPIVQKLYDALQTSSTLPDEARLATILHLEILSGIAKGLTRTLDLMADESSNDVQAEAEGVRLAREDPAAVKLRENIFNAIQGVVQLWSLDAAVGHALSELFKAITSLPSDITLITLPAGPLLELVCHAAQRQLTAAWLSLAGILISQLNPPSASILSSSTGNGATGGGRVPPSEAEVVVERLLPVLIRCGLEVLAMDGAMENNPDIVQEFFSFADRTAQEFTKAVYTLPPELFDGLVRCAVKALSLQERYSLVAACNFLATLIHRSSISASLSSHKSLMLATHGPSMIRAILEGFAAIAPRSAVPNLIELLGTILSRGGIDESVNGNVASNSPGHTHPQPGGTAVSWMRAAIMAEDFVPSKANPEVKERFIKAVASSRSLKKMREAAQQFMLVARGLEGSSFGYSSLTM